MCCITRLLDLLALPLCTDQRRATVEVVHDIEDVLFELVCRGARGEQSTDPEMYHRALVLGDERKGRLLDTIMEECVGAVPTEDEAGSDSFPQRCMYRFVACLVNHPVGLTRFGGHPESLARGAADAKNTSTVFAGVSPADGRPRPCWT